MTTKGPKHWTHRPFSEAAEGSVQTEQVRGHKTGTEVRSVEVRKGER